MVVAASPYEAEDAAEAVEISFEPLDAVLDPLDAVASGSAIVHAGLAARTSSTACGARTAPTSSSSSRRRTWSSGTVSRSAAHRRPAGDARPRRRARPGDGPTDGVGPGQGQALQPPGARGDARHGREERSASSSPTSAAGSACAASSTPRTSSSRGSPAGSGGPSSGSRIAASISWRPTTRASRSATSRSPPTADGRLLGFRARGLDQPGRVRANARRASCCRELRRAVTSPGPYRWEGFDAEAPQRADQQDARGHLPRPFAVRADVLPRAHDRPARGASSASTRWSSAPQPDPGRRAAVPARPRSGAVSDHLRLRRLCHAAPTADRRHGLRRAAGVRRFAAPQRRDGRRRGRRVHRGGRLRSLGARHAGRGARRPVHCPRRHRRARPGGPDRALADRRRRARRRSLASGDQPSGHRRRARGLRCVCEPHDDPRRQRHRPGDRRLRAPRARGGRRRARCSPRRGRRQLRGGVL